LALVLIGTAIGVPLALGGTQLVKSMLFGLGFADPIAILTAATLLALVGAVAGFLPAWRASQVDPMVALRHE
jgi:ABC-type antimicrobial peptide transport system permease subunit